MRIPAEMDEFRDYKHDQSVYVFCQTNRLTDLSIAIKALISKRKLGVIMFISGRDRDTCDSILFQTGLLKFRTMMKKIFFNNALAFKPYYSTCRPEYAVKPCMPLR